MADRIMSRFHRSGHFRTNAYGTTFWVTGHPVDRNVFMGPSLSLDLGESSCGIAFNTTCPICGAPVFFFRSDNGGAVFFDDLGKPWPRHPCTSSDERPSSRAAAPASIAPVSLEPLEAGASEVNVYPRDGQTYFEILGGEEAVWLRGTFPVHHNYMPGAWLENDDQGKIRALQFMTRDIELVEVQVRVSKRPPELTDALRAELGKSMKPRLIGLIKRLNSIAGAALATAKGVGIFGIGQIGGSRIFLVPLAIDHSTIESTTERKIFAYMGKTAALVYYTMLKNREIPPDEGYADHVIFVVDDLFGYFDNNINYYQKNRNEFESSDIDNYDGFNPNVFGSISWIDTSTEDIAHKPIFRTVNHALAAEQSFYAQQQIGNQKIGWRLLKGLLDNLNLLDLFQRLNVQLQALGWHLDQRGAREVMLLEELAFTYRHPDQASITEIQLLLHLSSLVDGLAFLVGVTSINEPLANHLVRVRDEAGITRMIDRAVEASRG